MSSLQWSHNISPSSLPFSQLVPPDLLNSPLSTILQSHPEELSWTGLSDTRLITCGTLCQLNFTVLRRGQIFDPNLCQNSIPISFTSPVLAPPNLHMSLLHQDPSGPSYLANQWPPNEHHCLDYQTWTQLAIFLLFLPHCMTLRYLLCSASNKTLLLSTSNWLAQIWKGTFWACPGLWVWGGEVGDMRTW